MADQYENLINPTEELAAYIEKLEYLQKLGINSYPYNFPVTHSPSEIRQCFDELLSTNIEVSTASRILSLRKAGKNLIFLDLAATSEQLSVNLHIQVMARRNELDETSWEVLKSSHLGDWIGVIGACFRTKTGEPSVLATKTIMLSKVTRPIPFPKVYINSDNENKRAYSLQDKEILWKYPELDMLIHHKAKTLVSRNKIINKTRELLTNHYNCIEIETPYLNHYFGGAEATPFSTFLNAFKQEMFLAISPEIELKRAIVGGLGSGGELGQGVFTFARNFRNEGVDKTHNPEFTSMEVYVPFVDYIYMMEVTENIFKQACIAVHGKAECYYGDVLLDFQNKWPRYPMTELVSEKSGIQVENWPLDRIKQEIVKRKLDQDLDIDETTSKILLEKRVRDAQLHHYYDNYENLSEKDLITIINRHKLHQSLVLEQEWDFIVMDLFEIYCEPFLIEPCHVILHPEKTTVLCKEYRNGLLPNGHKLIERFESYVMGMELTNAYSELNNPILQRKLVEEQAYQRAEGIDTAMPHNEAFLRSIEMGLPPTGGLGVGIDRLVMLLTNSSSIRDVIAFPMIGG